MVGLRTPELSRNDRINILAHQWYDYYKSQGYPLNQLRDWLIAERIVDAQDKAPEMEDRWKHRSSKMR